MERWKKEFDTVFAELFPGFNRNKRAITVDPNDLLWEMRNFKITEVEVEPYPPANEIQPAVNNPSSRKNSTSSALSKSKFKVSNDEI